MPVIKADCDLVTDTSRGTTLEQGEVRVSTVEHILAALVGMGIDNCLLKLTGLRFLLLTEAANLCRNY